MNLKKADPKIFNLIKKEIQRQKEGLVLIPSENYASPAVFKAMGTPLSNKYSEGYPRKRYYGGNEFIDEIEQTAIERAKRYLKLNTPMSSRILALRQMPLFTLPY